MNKRDYFRLKFLKRTRRARMITFFVLFSVFCLSVVLAYSKLIEIYANKIVGEAIVRLINDKSNEHLQISYESISIKAFSNKVEVENFMISDQRTQVGSTGHNLRVNVPYMYLDVDEVLLVWFRNKLNIHEVRFVKPNIEIVNYYTGLKPKRFTSETGDIIGILRKQLDVLKIKLLNIESANIQYFEQQDTLKQPVLFIPDLSLTLEDFEWDVNKDLKKLKSDGLTITIKNQIISLADSTYIVDFDQLDFSLAANQLTIYNTKISNLDKHQISDSMDDEPLNLEVPILQLSGIDYKAAYSDNELYLDSINIIEPELLFRRKVKIKTNKSDNKDIITVINSIFKQVHIEKIALKKGKADVEIQIKSNKHQLNSKHLNLMISGITLDTLSNVKIGYRSMLVVADNYSGVFQDSARTISVKQLSYSTTEKFIKVDSVVVKTIKSTEDADIDFTIPLAEISGFNDQLYFEKNQIEIDRFYLMQPELALYLKSTSKNAKSLTFNQLTNNVLTGLVNNIKVKELAISGSGLDLTTADDKMIKTRQTDIVAQNFEWTTTSTLMDILDGFAIDSHTIDINDGNKKIKGTGFYVNFNNKQLTLDHLAFNEQENKATFNNLKLILKEWPSNIDSLKIDAQLLSFQDYNIRWDERAFANKSSRLQPIVLIDSVHFKNGVVSIYNQKSTTETNVTLLTGNSIILNKTFSIDQFGVNLKAASYKDSKSNISIGKIDFNTKKALLMVADLNADLSIGRDSIRFKAPHVTANAIQAKKLIDQNTLAFDQLNFTNWEFGIYPSKQQQKPKAAFSFKMAGLKSINLNKLSFKNGTINSGKDGLLASEKVNIEFNEIRIDSASQANPDPEGVFYAKSMNANLHNILYNNGSAQINIKQLAYEKDGTIGSKQIAVQYKNKTIFKGDSVGLTSLKFNDLIYQSALKMAILNVFEPVVDIDLNRLTVFENDNPFFKVIDIDTVSVMKARLGVVTKNSGEVYIDPLDIVFYHMNYDAEKDNSNMLFPVDSVSFITEKLKYVTNDKLSEVTVNKIAISKNLSSIRLKGIHVTPRYRKEEYMVQKGYETDWIKSSIREVEFSNLNYRELLNNKSLISSQVIISSPVLNVYRDKNLKDSLPDFRPMPGSLLKGLSTIVDIEEVQVKNGAIVYEEVPEKGSDPGSVVFEKLNASFHNITNIPDKVRANPILDVKLNTLAYDVPFQAQFQFHLDSKDDRVDFSGVLEETDLLRFNLITENVAFVKIESGESKTLNLNVTAFNDMGYGGMNFHYNNLKISLVNKQTQQTNRLEESVASFFANTFLIKKNNFAFIRPRKGDIYFERNQQRSFFNYLAKIFLSGVQSSIGMKNNKRVVKRMKSQALTNLEGQ
ncbi:MAG TPA: hypothetical protein PKL31_10075 [Fulvivirga sp.]|nr:hypothetical protein [Fulvivirga sp.]